MSVTDFLDQNQAFADALASNGLTDKRPGVTATFEEVLPESAAEVTDATGRHLFDGLLGVTGAATGTIRAFMDEFRTRLEAEQKMVVTDKTLIIAVDMGELPSVAGKSADEKVYIPPVVPPALFAALVGLVLYRGTQYYMAHYGPVGPSWFRNLFHEP